jgi:hypothetical protein
MFCVLHRPIGRVPQSPDSARFVQRLRINFPNKLIAGGKLNAARDVKVKEGQCFQDGTGLTVRVVEINVNDRVHFSVIEDQGVAGSGDMSNSARQPLQQN